MIIVVIVFAVWTAFSSDDYGEQGQDERVPYQYQYADGFQNGDGPSFVTHTQGIDMITVGIDSCCATKGKYDASRSLTLL